MNNDSLMLEPTKQVSVDLFKDLVTCVGICVIFVTTNPEAATADVYKKRCFWKFHKIC